MRGEWLLGGSHEKRRGGAIFGHCGQVPSAPDVRLSQRNAALSDTSQLHLLEVFRREISPVCCLRPCLLKPARIQKSPRPIWPSSKNCVRSGSTATRTRSSVVDCSR